MDATTLQKWRLDLNQESNWAKTLLERGREVHIFDAFYDDLRTPIVSPEVGAAFLRKILEANIVKAVLFDMHYHKDMRYGLNMLRALKTSGCRSIEGPRWIVYSTFLNSEEDLRPENIQREFGDMIVAVESRIASAKKELINLLDRMDRPRL